MVISLVALALIWNSFASIFPNKIGAIVVNAAVSWGLLIGNWPMEADNGF
jgi:hypothetical protein